MRRSVAALVLAAMLVVGLGVPVAAEVDPAEVELSLAVGESADVTKLVSVPGLPAQIDVCVLLDRSRSFERDLVALRENVPAILDLDVGRDVGFGLAGFVDYPQAPFGFPGDVAYELLTPIGDRAAFVAALDGLSLGRGADPSEAQLDAVVAAVGPGDGDCGWRPLPATRVLVATTDSLCHGPDGTHQASEADAIAAMTAAQVTFIGLVESSDAVECFEPLATATGGAVQELRSDGADIAAAVAAAFDESVFAVTPSLDPECLGLTATFDPPVLTGLSPNVAVELVETITLVQADGSDPIGCVVDFGLAGTQTIVVNPIPPDEPPTPTATVPPTPTATVPPTSSPTPAATATSTPEVLQATVVPATTPATVVTATPIPVVVPTSAPMVVTATPAPVVASVPALPVVKPKVTSPKIGSAQNAVGVVSVAKKTDGPILSVTGGDPWLLVFFGVGLIGLGLVVLGLRARVPGESAMVGVASRRSTKHLVVLLVAALFTTALYASERSPVAAAPVLGGQLYSTGGLIQVEVLPATATLDSDLFLFEPEEQLIATNRDVGTVVEVGPFPAGVELVFGIRVDGNEFRLGPADRNPDGLVHGQVDFVDATTAVVGFEDLLGGGDLDYDDNVFQFSGQLAAAPPQVTPDPVPLPVVDAGADQSVVEGDVVSLVASEPVGPGVGAQSLVASVDRRTFPNDPDTSIEVSLNGLANGVVDGSVNLTSFGGESFNLINVIDLSGSTEFDLPGCGGDENGDGLEGSILDCEVLAIVTLNDRLANGTDVQTALVPFGGRAATADLSPADGIQAFTSPVADVDGNGVADLVQAVRSVDVGVIEQFTRQRTTRFFSGTNFGAAVAEACEVAANGQADRTVVAFMSDGQPDGSSGIDLPCGDVTFRTFAVGGDAACEGRGTPSLQAISDLTGGSCVEIADVSELPDVFSLSIAPQVVGARLVVDGGAPVDVSDSLGNELPSSGELTLVFDTADLLVGASELCLEVDVRDSVGVTAVETCSRLRQSDGTYTYQWRTAEQNGPPVLLIGANTATPSFVAFDDGRYVFEVLATDNVGQTVTDTVEVVVDNADPVVSVSSFDPSVGGVALVSGEFADPGWDDVHSVRVSWGDGTVTEGVVGVQASGQGTVFGTHVYETPGAYDVSVTVSDDDGGSGTESVTAPPQITSPAAVWANAATDAADPVDPSDLAGAALTFTGSNVSVDGLVHSNASINVASCTNSFGGTVRYVTALNVEEFCGEPNDALALPLATTVAEAPLLLDIGDYSPDGSVRGVVPGEYFDKTDRCRDGQWRIHDQDLAPGIYFVDCDVDFSNASGEVTIIATGEIRATGDGLDFRPFFGSLLFLSGATASPAVTVTSTNSRFAGAVYAIDGAVVLDGEDNAFVCGIYGDTVTLAGDRTTVAGADCGDRPAGSIAAALQPDLALALTTDTDILTPGDTATFDLSLTNQGATFVVPGVAGLQNIDSTPVTVNDLGVTVETRTAGSDTWSPAAGIADVEVVVSPTAAAGVTNPDPTTVTGTTVAPNAIAVWGFQAIADLDPATIATLTNPTQTTGIRLRVTFDSTPGLQVRPLYEIGENFAPSVHAQTGAVTDTDATFLTSNGSTRVVPLDDLAPGATITETLDLSIAVPEPIRPGEPSAAYINRLRMLDNSDVIGAVFAVGSSDGQRVIAPIATDNATVQLPIVDTQKSGPTNITSGDVVPWSIRLVNVGSAPATEVDVIDTFGDQSLPVEDVTSNMSPGAVVVASTSTLIPPDVIREFTENRADTTWQDANANTYGPTFGISPLDVYSGPQLRAILVDELAADPDGNSLITPGDTIRYTTTITNSGDRALTNVVVTVPLDPNTTFEGASLLGGTLTSDPTGPTLEIAVGTIAGVSQTDVSWAVTIVDPFPAGASAITSSATVTSAELPPVPASDPAADSSGTATETTIVVPFPVLEFTLGGQLRIDSESSGSVTPGDTLSYRGDIINTGNAAAEAAVATITLGPGLSLVAGTTASDPGLVTETADGFSLDLATLDADEGAAIEFQAVIDTALAAGQTDVTVSGEVAAAGIEPVSSDDPNTDTAADPTSIQLGSTGVPVPGPGGTGGAPPPVSDMPAVSTGAALAIDDTPINPGTGATCTSITPTSGTTITEPTNIVATIETDPGTTIATWRVFTYLAGQPSASSELASGEGATPAVLATLDPGAYPNGTRTVLIETTNDAGAVARCETDLIIEGDLDLGRFTTTYSDLNVPVGGIPIQVLRTYDTQRRDIIGDFGNGWDLTLGNFTAQTNTQIGTGPWTGEQCGPAFLVFATICYTSTESRYVTITWPDGRVESFDITFEAINLLAAFGVTPKYEPRDGATSTLQPAPGDSSPSLGPDGNLNNGLLTSGEIYNPQRFILTDTTGTRYLIDKSTGLVTQTDQSGNTLTIDADGIRSSLGPEIAFTRDPQGRITQITDPAGAAITYTYNTDGDLVSLQDQNGNVTTFGYSLGHYLNEIDDPGPGPAQRYTYDDDGNLTGITDANGNTTAVSINQDDRTQISTSPDGRLTTVTVFDSRGNPISVDEIYDGENHVTTIVYDNNRVASRTDPAGNTYSFTFDSAGNALTYTDALGNVTEFAYDENNQPTRVTYADGTTKTIGYNDRGLPTTITDGAGTRTAEWDSAGNLLGLTDELGQSQRWTYNNGRVATYVDTANRTTSFTYDALGNPTLIEGPGNQSQRRSYDAIGNLTSATDSLGRMATYEYDANSRLTSHTDAFGRTTTYSSSDVGDLENVSYDNGETISREFDNGRVVSETDSAGRITRFTYTGNNKIATVTDPNGVISAFTYDAAGRRVSTSRTVNGETTVTSIAYDALGQIVGYTDEFGTTTTTAYDVLGRVTATTDQLGRTISYDYDAAGNNTTVTNAAGETTTTDYDTAGRPIATVDAEGAATTYAYDPQGNLTSETDPLGRTWTYGYNDDGQLISTTSPSGATTSQTYDSIGRPLTFADSQGVTTSYSYDQATGRVASISDALGNTQSYRYDSLGRPATQTDGRGNTTSYTYDLDGHVTAITDPLGGTIAMSYDPEGRQIALTDPTGAVRRTTYNPLGLTETTADALGRTTTYGYDPAGRLATSTDPRGDTITRTYDPAGQLLTETGPNNQNTYTWDNAGRMASMTNQTGTTTISYDRAGRTTSVSAPQGEIRYEYNPAGERVAMVTPEGRTTYGYDADGNLATVTDPTGFTTTSTFRGNGAVERVERSNQINSDYTYDTAGRLVGIEHSGPQGTASFAYTLDAAGNRTSVTDATGTTSYSIDANNRLTNAAYPDGTSEAFNYDAAGNRTSSTDQTGQSLQYQLDAAGQIAASSNGVTYQFDNAGNLIGTSDGDQFTYDDFGNMTAATVAGVTETYQYNAIGRRVSVNGDVELWDEANALPQLVISQGQSYTHTPSGIVAGDTSVQLPDALGSTRAIADASSLTALDYTAFGTPTGPTPDVFGFTGGRHDNTGLVHLLARQYEPTSGRFLTADPIQPGGPGTGGWNLYSYAANNPTTWTDPTGQTVALSATLIYTFILLAALVVFVTLLPCTSGLAPCPTFPDIDFNLPSIGGGGGTGGGATADIAVPGGLPLPNVLSPERLEEVLEALGDKVGSLTRTAAETIAKTCAAYMVASQLFPVNGIGRCEGNENIYFPGSDLPDIRSHIASNISTRPTNIQLNRRLQRWDNNFVLRAKRNGDCSSKPPSWFCDEYPFATAQQGGEANYQLGLVTLRSVNPALNPGEGPKLNAFYSSCRVVGEGQRFFVIPVARIPTTRICG